MYRRQPTLDIVSSANHAEAGNAPFQAFQKHPVITLQAGWLRVLVQIYLAEYVPGERLQREN
jgi:hypothetical protein